MRIALVLLIVNFATCQNFKCFQCATPNLRQNWIATGFPKRPANLVYSEACTAPTADMRNAVDQVVENCATSCFTLLLPIQGTYAMVRGCHADFVWSELVVTANETAASCEANPVDGYGAVQFQGAPTKLANAFAALRFCKPTGDVIFCNEDFTAAKVSDSAVEGCTSGTQRTCKECNEYDGTGECSASTMSTCKGVYCTKTSGTLNDGYYETRGCSGFNPFGGRDACSWNDQTLNLSTIHDSVGFSFKANQCFCSGNECNSSPKLATAVLPPLLLIILMRYF